MEKHNYFFIYFLILINCIFALITLVVTSIDLVSVQQELDQYEKITAIHIESLELMYDQQSEKIEEQNKTIEFYKNYCDDVASNIVNGNW